MRLDAHARPINEKVGQSLIYFALVNAAHTKDWKEPVGANEKGWPPGRLGQVPRTRKLHCHRQGFPFQPHNPKARFMVYGVNFNRSLWFAGFKRFTVGSVTVGNPASRKTTIFRLSIFAGKAILFSCPIKCLGGRKSSLVLSNSSPGEAMLLCLHSCM